MPEHRDGFYCLSVLEEVLQQRGQLELRDEVQARPSDAASDAEAAQLAEGAGCGCKRQAECVHESKPRIFLCCKMREIKPEKSAVLCSKLAA